LVEALDAFDEPDIFSVLEAKRNQMNIQCFSLPEGLAHNLLLDSTTNLLEDRSLRIKSKKRNGINYELSTLPKIYCS
jgi:hypothetical protein